MTKPTDPLLSVPPGGLRQTATPRRVLIVEDNLDSARTLAALVANGGHIVECAINGYAAIVYAQGFKPHIVLLDLGLPGIDGFEVCSRLKAEPGLERVRIIAVTAYSDDESRRRAGLAGCDLHLVKPVSPETLLDALDSIESGRPS